MKSRTRLYLSLFATALLALSGCQREHDHADAGHAHDGGAHGHSHGDDAESFSGATHKEGEGITLLAETCKLLDLKTEEVSQRQLSHEVCFTARLLDAVATSSEDPRPRLAVGNVSTNNATLLRTGMAVVATLNSGATASGEVRRVSTLLAHDDAEVVVALPATRHGFEAGGFVEITVSLPAEKPVLVVPQSAVIHGATGDLVYAVNGDAYLLTWVELGAKSDGLVEITDGLLEGDQVVTTGAMDLWLVELRAQKGGQGCCPAPPKKEKK